MAETYTQTGVTHYEVQKKRRESTLDWWRGQRKTVQRIDDVVMHETSRRMRRGVQASADADLPTVVLDHVNHEIDPGVTSTIHRHSWDAIVFVTEGTG